MSEPTRSPVSKKSKLSRIPPAVGIGLAFVGILALGMLALLMLKKSPTGDKANSAQVAEGSGLGDANQDEEGVILEEGQILPDFAWKTLPSTEVRFQAWLDQDPSSKVVVVNFWATWCDACVDEMPSLLKLESKYQTQGLRLLPINVDEDPTHAPLKMARAQKWTDSKAFSMIHADVGQKLGDLFDIQGIPLTILLNRKREILWVESGGRNWDEKEIWDKLALWLK